MLLFTRSDPLKGPTATPFTNVLVAGLGEVSGTFLGRFGELFGKVFGHCCLHLCKVSGAILRIDYIAFLTRFWRETAY